MYAFKYSLTVAPAPRRGWNKFRPLQAPGANFWCKFSFLKTYEITSHSPDGLAPPTAPLKGLVAAFLRMPRSSSLLVQDSNLPPKAANEPFPPKAPMKPFHPKPRWKITRKNGKKKTAIKSVFLLSGKGLDASQVSAEGPAARTCLKTPKDWMAAWSNLEYYFYYIGTNASLKGLRSRGFPSFHPVLLLASTRLPGIYGSNAETDSGPCSVPVWDMQSSRSIVAMLFFNQRCAKLWHPSRCSCLLFAVASAFLGLACFNFPLSRISKWKWNW